MQMTGEFDFSDLKLVESHERAVIECPVCFDLLESPYLVSCCGNHFCQACIGQLSLQPCPLCAETTFTSMLDKGLQCHIQSREVYCTNMSLGCVWQGKVLQFESHFSNDCLFAAIPCPQQCGVKVCRKDISDHVQNLCDLRPSQCKDCQQQFSTWSKCKEHEAKECPNALVPCPQGCHVIRNLMQHHIDKECPFSMVQCHFSETGCKWKGPRGDRSQHMMASFKKHTELAIQHSSNSKVAKLQKKITQLEETVKELQEELDDDSEYDDSDDDQDYSEDDELDYSFTVDPFENGQLLQTAVSSPRFYSDNPGYCFVVSVYPNGVFSAKGKYVSVYTHIANGSKDHMLKWPFRGSVTISLIPSKKDLPKFKKTIVYNDKTSDDCAGCVTTWGCKSKGIGISQFISHDQMNSDFLNSDGLLTFIFDEVQLA